jgi:AcrR family transcriptional regulator
VRKPAEVRRQEILAAAAVEFAETGLAGTRLEAIAARAEVSHPRVVQMFGTKRALFLEVVAAVFGRISTTITEAGGISPTIEHELPLVMLQGYAAAADEVVRHDVAHHYLTLQRTVADLTGADVLQIRTFFATGLIVTVSTALALPGKRLDATWAAHLLAMEPLTNRRIAPLDIPGS